MPLGPGLSSLAVAGGRVFTQVRRMQSGQPQEFAVGLDAETGAEFWATPVGVADYPNGGVGGDDGPRSTPAVAGDSVIILASHLKLWCLDAATGGERWSRDLHTEFGGVVIPWQNAASPIVVDGLVLVNGNGPGQCLLAFRMADGTLAWKGHNDRMTHATPVAAEIGGVRQVVFFAQTGLVGVLPATGEVIWRHGLNYNGTSVAASPVIDGDMIYASRAYPVSLSAARAGAVVVRLNHDGGGWATEPLWYRINQLMNHWSTPVIHNGHVYGHFGQSTLTFKCVELTTGIERWSESGFGYGSVLIAGENLLVQSASGELVLVAPDPEAYTELGRFRALDGKCWNVPAISDGRIYLRSTLEAICLEVAAAVPAALSLRTSVTETTTVLLTVATADGSAIEAGRAARIEVQSTTDPTRAPGAWTPVTIGVVLTNGQLQLIDSEVATVPRRFFRAIDRP